MVTGSPLDIVFGLLQFIVPIALSIIGPLIGALIESLLNPPA